MEVWTPVILPTFAMLRFATLLTSYPGSVAQGDPDDLGAPAREEAIELVAVLATANWTNRFDDGLQTPPG